MGVKKALSKYYNVVLMDIQMPGLDGHQAVAHLRAQGLQSTDRGAHRARVEQRTSKIITRRF